MQNIAYVRREVLKGWTSCGKSDKIHIFIAGTEFARMQRLAAGSMSAERWSVMAQAKRKDDRYDASQADLDRGIREFLQEFKLIEQQCVGTEKNDDLQKAIADAIYRMSRFCKAYEEAVAFDKELMSAARKDFRSRTDKYFLKSYFMHRARTWPLGYPGDYETLENIYRAVPLSTGIGCYLDRHFLATTLGTAVRDRKDLVLELLKKELAVRTEPGVLDLACGSCREIVELSREIREAKARVICVDIDSAALDFAAGRLAYANFPASQVVFRKYNAIKMINHERNLKEFGMQDVIYSVGLFDYLDDAILSRILQALYELLNPGGRLIATFKDRTRYETYDYHWFVDWASFFQRTEEDARRILGAAGIPADKLTMQRDRTGAILFFLAAR